MLQFALLALSKELPENVRNAMKDILKENYNMKMSKIAICSRKERKNKTKILAEASVDRCKRKLVFNQKKLCSIKLESGKQLSKRTYGVRLYTRENGR